ncbi:efflux RND transporter periplasmic adaptor subunit [Actinacidiphila sp. ITFR-21]|uniref:efflux RND transporter periplasmic adaptor subunit n=1 Tax=Actinacidiphila sp. ITFR-21 TaxID=3075199 RepID=UPI00288A99F3|nr:biotin/lipoyl-binding protein [Streptomyces sp. ITFR-21]WNI16771.1 biotin/lipoyl-binding protein [Streptomyces sp. ITFR-21]
MKVLPRRRRAVLINSVLGVVVLAGAGGAYAAVHDDGGGSSAAVGARVATVTRTTVLATVSGSGSLASPSDAGVDFTTGGTLTQVNVKPGDKVKKGQVLARVDPTDANATLQQDEASLTAAEANLTKVEEGELPASSGNSGSSGAGGGTGAVAPTPTPTPTPTVDPAQLAQAQAQLTQAQNAVDAARRAVDGCVLKAPVAGTVASVAAEAGDTVTGTNGNGSGASGGSGSSSSGAASTTSSGTAPTGFVVLTNPAGMQVKADFSESDALKIKAGQAATVTLNAEPGTVLNAKVLSISSLPVSSGSSSGGSGSGSGSAVQYAATLGITSDTSDLRTGLSASIQVTTAQAADALSVPTAAVSGTGAARTVLVVGKDGSTTRTSVTVGVEGDSADQITAGLTEGQQVQIPQVASAGNGGFPSGAFPGGIGTGGIGTGGSRFGGTSGGFRTGGLGGGGGRG